MKGVKFDKSVNKYKMGGIVDIPYPHTMYMVVSYAFDSFKTTKYDFSVKFIKKARTFENEEIDMVDTNKEKER